MNKVDIIELKVNEHIINELFMISEKEEIDPLLAKIIEENEMVKPKTKTTTTKAKKEKEEKPKKVTKKKTTKKAEKEIKVFDASWI